MLEWVIIASLLGGSVYKRENGQMIEWKAYGQDGGQLAEYIRTEHKLRIEWMPEPPMLIVDREDGVKGTFIVHSKWFGKPTYVASWSVEK